MGAMTATVVGLNVAGWGMLAAALGGHYHISKTTVFGFGTGALAYTLGMRHAFDADHIAAIDNTTRKLVGDGKRPLSVGFFFSLGHSSVVFALAVLLNFGIRGLDEQVKDGGSHLQYTTNIIGTCVSGFFLFLIAAFNIVILAGILKVFREMRSGAYDDEELEGQLNERGLMNRFLGPLARRVDTPWKMYPIGFLFGLGFDTATEVALLVLAGTAVVGGLPFYAILSLPILFAAGMSLFDTIDGCFMNFAYDWAFAQPVRKVYYNLTITGLSVFVAVFIGATELLGLLARHQPQRLVLVVHGELQHQHGRLPRRRCIRADLGRRPGHLALRPHRAEVGGPPGRRPGPASRSPSLDLAVLVHTVAAQQAALGSDGYGATVTPPGGWPPGATDLAPGGPGVTASSWLAATAVGRSPADGAAVRGDVQVGMTAVASALSTAIMPGSAREPEWAEHMHHDVLPGLCAGLGPRGSDAGDRAGPRRRITEWLRRRVAGLVAVEVEKDAADVLRERFAGTNVQAMHGDASALPFDDDSFDSAGSFTMLHPVP